MERKDLLIKSKKDIEKRMISIGNEIIKTRYKLTLPTQKLLLFLISHITYEERKEGKFLHTLRFPLSDIYEFFKTTGRDGDKNLKNLLQDSIEELKIKSVDIKKIYAPNLEKDTYLPWHSEIDIDQKKKQFKFSFNDKMASVLLNIKGYFKSYLKEYIYLRSSHAINLYMFFRAHEHLRTIHKRASVEELKYYLQVNDSKAYEKWPEFKRRILDLSIDQLNQNTSYLFTYTLDRLGKSIGFINFSLLDKKDQNAISIDLHKRIVTYLLKKKLYKLSHRLFEEVKFSYIGEKNFLFVLLPFKHFLKVSKLDLREYRYLERQYNQLKENLQAIFLTYDFKNKVFLDFFRKEVKVAFFKYDPLEKNLPSIEFLHQEIEKAESI